MNDVPSWESLSDEEIAGMPFPPEEGSAANETEPAVEDPTAESEPAEELEVEGNDPEVTGGADEPEQPDTDNVDAEGDLDSEEAEPATSDPFDGTDPEPPEDDQSEETEEKEEPAEDLKPEDVEFRAKYEELMAPFKAAGREIKLDNPDQARRLMQMGVDYNLKMQTLKPHLRTLRTLEKANLLDPERVNFLIDLSEKKPEAIKKLLRDGSIDPMDLDMENNETYSPTDHTVSEQEMGIREAFEAIENDPTFDQTVNILTKEWDSKSRVSLADNPSLIGFIHAHIANGTYDQVWSEVMKQRVLGQLVGLSDLEAYDQTGQAMASAGQLGPPSPQKATSSAPNTSQAPAQGTGSPKSNPKKTAQKRAASPTKGGGNSGRGK